MFIRKVFLSMIGPMIASSFCLANTHPHDLNQLVTRWTSLEKSEDCAEHINVQAITIEDEESYFTGEINNALTKYPLRQVSNFHYEYLDEEVHSNIMGRLFAKKKEIPHFCRGIGSVLTELASMNEEGAEPSKIEKKAYSICKKNVSKLLSGIFFANPKTYLFSSQAKEGYENTDSLTIYVASLVERSEYLKYTFKL
ncbi:MAG: hypothetical protein HRU09_20200 [Oligoflexales bacterium]|nr:hypothetical protein [Oligoflexales bacterium]